MNTASASLFSSRRLLLVGIWYSFTSLIVAGQGGSFTYRNHDRRVAAFHAQVPGRIRQRASTLPMPAVTAPKHLRSFRVKPTDFGADPTGVSDSTTMLQDAVSACVNRSVANTNGVFPGMEDGWGPVRDAGGCVIDLDGGEYRISGPVVIPEFVANMEFGHGSIFADALNFPRDSFLLVVGVKGSCQVPQGSCNMDLNFPDLFLDGGRVANAMQVNNVMGTTVGPGAYFLNFTSFGLQINKGHEVMMDRSWLGETNFDYNFEKHGVRPRSTAIEINGNDHYILNTIVFSSRIGVAVNGAADVITGVHVWFPVNRALHFNDTMAFYIPQNGNRFTGCYADGGRVVFEGAGLSNNFWVNGFECCAGAGVKHFPHGIILKGDNIGPGLYIFNNIFQGGDIWHEPSSLGRAPKVVDTRIVDNSDHTRNARATRATQNLAQTDSSKWIFDFCNQLVVPTIASVRVSLQAEQGFPRHMVRPTTNCTVLVETDIPVSGTMTVDVDSSEYSSKSGEIAVTSSALAWV